MEVKTITVLGRRWFQRSYGNTYFTAHVVVTGINEQGEDCVHRHNMPKEYGGGLYYEQAATEWLQAAGYLPGIEEYANGGMESLWRYCQRMNIELIAQAEDVSRMRDLHNVIPAMGMGEHFGVNPDLDNWRMK